MKVGRIAGARTAVTDKLRPSPLATLASSKTKLVPASRGATPTKPPPEHKTLAASAPWVAQQPMLLLVCTLLQASLDAVVLSQCIVAMAAISVYQDLQTLRHFAMRCLLILAHPTATACAAHSSTPAQTACARRAWSAGN